MRLNRLDLARYGKFTDKRLDFGAERPGVPDFHLVYGPNEAGKSTLFSAYLDLLFGIEAQSAYGFLHPYPTMRIGGDVTVGGVHHEVARLKRRQGSLVGPDDRMLPDSLFDAVLGAMDRQAYRMMFSLDDDSIERGGEGILKSEGELGSLLFSASSGLSDMGQALEQARVEADAFYRPQARKHELAARKAEIEALREQRKALDIAAREYGALTRQLESSAGRYDEAFRARTATRTAIEELERRLAAIPLLRRLREIRTRLAEFDAGETPPKEWTGLVGQLQRDEAELSARGERLAGELARRCAAREEVTPDPDVLAVAADIEALAGSDLGARYRTATLDLAGRMTERDRLDAEIAEKQGLLGLAGADPSSLLLRPDKAEALSALVSARSGLVERLAAARREAEEAARGCEAAGARLAALGAGEAEAGAEETKATLLTLVRAAKLNALTTRLREAEREAAVAQAALAGALDRLRPGIAEIEGLRALEAPGRETVEALRNGVSRNTERALKLAEQARAVSLDLSTQRSGLEQMRRSETLVSDEEADALRAARDAAWQAHRATLDAASAERFERALAGDDRASAQRLAQADRLSEARLLEKAIAEHEARLQVLSGDIRRTRAERAALAGQVAVIADRLGLRAAGDSGTTRREDGRNRPAAAAASLSAAALTPKSAIILTEEAAPLDPVNEGVGSDEVLAELDAVERWLDRRTAALEAADLFSQRQAALAIVAKEADEMARRLAAALGRQPAEVGAAVVDELLLRAEDEATALGERLAARRAALEGVVLAQQRRSERETASKDAEAAMAAWQADWEQTCAGTWLAAAGIAADAERAVALLPLIQAISRLVDTRRELDRRIDAMRRDQAEYGRIAGALTEKLAAGPTDDPLGAVAALVQRLRTAREGESQRARLGEEIAALEQEAREQDQRRAVHEQRVREILMALGCETLTDASFALQRYREREDLRERADEAAQDLAQAMLASSAEQAEAALAATDEAELAAERARLRAVHEEQDHEVRELHAARLKAADALAAIGADGSAAALEERRQTLVLDLADRARGYLAARAGIAAAEAALRLYRERHRSAMMRQASDALHTISGGEYTGLATVVEKDQEVLVATAAGGGSKLAREMSKGTRFQLYLALRVAGYHQVAASREILPFIADDIMETFDDDRALNAFRLMADMSRVGQVIYLTHHQHLRDIARTACPDVVIHEL